MCSFLFFIATATITPAQTQQPVLEQPTDEDYIHHAADLIEIQMEWGSIQRWTDFEFQRLSDVMHDSTGMRVNKDELVAILAKHRYDPELATSLNALAQFLHYLDWTSFEQQNKALKSDMFLRREELEHSPR